MMDRPLSRSETIGLGALGLMSFIGLWEALSYLGIVPGQFLPTPVAVIARFINL
ncbi:MAG: ABC transporter permease, partial [Hyphomicrobiales bacterium]|nr:ABC transporter permease [Hyphomicrobiales bacterium]